MSDELYTTAFTSKDFVEGDPVERAEVFVVVGRGTVKEIVTSGSGKAKQVVIDAGKEHNGRPLYSKGWAPVDSNILKKAEEASKNDSVIDFRIETVRNDKNTRTHEKVDRSIPIADLKKGMENARENVTHSIAAIKLSDEEKWTEGIMRTNPKEDTKKTGRTALDLSDDEIGSKKSSSSSYTPANLFEPQPWVLKNRHGEIQPGSTAVAVPLTMYSFVSEWERENSLNLGKDKFDVTEALINAANKLQIAIYADSEEPLEKPDLSLGSHTRARALVFDIVKTFYPIDESIVSDLDSWVDSIVDKGTKMWKWSIKHIEKLGE